LAQVFDLNFVLGSQFWPHCNAVKSAASASQTWQSMIGTVCQYVFHPTHRFGTVGVKVLLTALVSRLKKVFERKASLNDSLY
jgi:hypothetical protein